MCNRKLRAGNVPHNSYQNWSPAFPSPVSRWRKKHIAITAFYFYVAVAVSNDVGTVCTTVHNCPSRDGLSTQGAKAAGCGRSWSLNSGAIGGRRRNLGAIGIGAAHGEAAA